MAPSSGKATLVAKRSDDGLQIALEIHVNGTPLAHAFLDGAEIQDAIAMLAAARQSLVETEHPPRELEHGSRLVSVTDPIWRIPAGDQNGMKLLALRHPGIGWLGFLLPPVEAAGIADWLTRQTPETPTG